MKSRHKKALSALMIFVAITVMKVKLMSVGALDALASKKS